MLKLFFKSALGGIRKDKFHAFLNLIGLALGLAAFLYITTYVFHELSFDKFHSKEDRIYRIISHIKMGDSEEKLSRSEVPFAITAKNELPEVEEAARLYYDENYTVKYLDNRFIEPFIWYADSSIFNIFDIRLLDGDPSSAFSDPNSILLTEKTARKYFGDEDPIDKFLYIEETRERFVVSGILEEMPENSTLQFDILANFKNHNHTRRQNDWGNYGNLFSFVLVKENTDFESFKQKINEFPRKYYDKLTKDAMGISLNEFEQQGNFVIHTPQKIRDIHLNAEYTDKTQRAGNMRLVIGLSATGLLILFMACFNFINLSTARAALRTKEISIKRMIGSGRSLLIWQILLETFMYCLIALIIALGVFFTALPALNDFSEIVLKPKFLLNTPTLISVISIPFVITLFAGLYPAFFITRAKPVLAVKGAIVTGKNKSTMRGMLVVTQFAIFILLIFSTTIIRKQIYFLQQQNPGYQKENVIVIKGVNRLGDGRNSFKNELLKYPEVLSASYSSEVPSIDEEAGNPFRKSDSDKMVILDRMNVDENFAGTYDIQMKAGQFYKENSNPNQDIVINEAAAKMLGIEGVDNQFVFDYNNNGRTYKLIGITKDFQLMSLHELPTPMVFQMADVSNYLSVRIRPGNIRNVMMTIKDEWDHFHVDTPLEYFFVDKALDAQYREEERLGKIIGLFSVFAVIIACIGLLGLVSFTTVQKQKEIGIRKVNGAKVMDLLTLLNKDFVKWVIIAFVVVMPLTWYIMQKWLESFAYRTEMSWWVFMATGALTIIISIVTVSLQCWKAATRNPVDALRYE